MRDRLAALRNTLAGLILGIFLPTARRPSHCPNTLGRSGRACASIDGREFDIWPNRAPRPDSDTTGTAEGRGVERRSSLQINRRPLGPRSVKVRRPRTQSHADVDIGSTRPSNRAAGAVVPGEDLVTAGMLSAAELGRLLRCRRGGGYQAVDHLGESLHSGGPANGTVGVDILVDPPGDLDGVAPLDGGQGVEPRLLRSESCAAPVRAAAAIPASRPGDPLRKAAWVRTRRSRCSEA